MIIKTLIAAGTVSLALAGTSSALAATSTGHSAAAARPAATVQHLKPAPEAPGQEASGEASPAPGDGPGDGPGGHQDAAGQNVDHQFSGTE